VGPSFVAPPGWATWLLDPGRLVTLYGMEMGRWGSGKMGRWDDGDENAAPLCAMRNFRSLVPLFA